ncbi:acireductone synthase [Hahella sp. SMD15-11]|uniref:Enolase-phosphatase E1 n=1 Tax=Thermohahella caldifontis TaxID=3142973 RepID=A0AB39UVA8_9GAMM
MIQAIVTDIEGTTSAISFVHEVLFPYAAAHLPDFVRQHAQEPAVREQLDATAAEAGLDPADTEALIGQLLQWIREDRKITPLKALQGMIWKDGYARGDYTGHVYPDAAESLRRWKSEGKRLYVYSSGSVEAQKQLFGHSDAGDLTSLFSGYFDTRIGAKREAASYRRILDEIGLPGDQVLFLSDVVAELDAARAAGMRTCQLVREGTVAGDQHPVARTFDEVPLD